ncbi:hypothetical protein MW887_010324 [Aspergillus wentii]|nr:hypothetical protein MW887_010324 [Aspergillus wentii]
MSFESPENKLKVPLVLLYFIRFWLTLFGFTVRHCQIAHHALQIFLVFFPPAEARKELLLLLPLRALPRFPRRLPGPLLRALQLPQCTSRAILHLRPGASAPGLSGGHRCPRQ